MNLKIKKENLASIGLVSALLSAFSIFCIFIMIFNGIDGYGKLPAQFGFIGFVLFLISYCIYKFGVKQKGALVLVLMLFCLMGVFAAGAFCVVLASKWGLSIQLIKLIFISVIYSSAFFYFFKKLVKHYGW